LIRAGSLAAAAGGAAVTWNPVDKAATVTLSGGDLIATSSGAGTEGTVRSTTSKSSGKYYFEARMLNYDNNRPSIGIANATQSLTTGLGLTVNSNAIYPELDAWYYNNVAGDGIDLFMTDNALIYIAADLDNGKLWMKYPAGVTGHWNKDAADNPATNTGGQTLSVTGPYYISAGMAGGAASVELFIASAAWAGSPPSGFGEWT
jgi:hypothetical protein